MKLNKTEPTLAEDFLAECCGYDTNQIMNALGGENLEADQDWDEGATTWRFSDGSGVRVCGPEVEAISAE